MNGQRERDRCSSVYKGYRYEKDENGELRDTVRREERQQLANDLHDSLAQVLFALTLQTRALELVVQRRDEDLDGAVTRGFAELKELTHTALGEMRAMIFQLRPEALHEDGLVAALRRHAATVAARDGLEVTVQAFTDHLPLDEPTELALFQMVREAVHNSAKHAHPDHIEIRLYEPINATGTLVIEVADDGAGFDPDEPRPGHLGLKTMRERTEGIGGQLTIDSSPTGSTTVRAVLPCDLPGPAPQQADDRRLSAVLTGIAHRLAGAYAT
jgi:signal transduction histidine kinase